MRVLGWVGAWLLFAAGLGLMFRNVWLPGPAWSVGDNGDGVIEIATLEHWFRFLTGGLLTRGAGSLVSAPWFFPAPGSLGRTDTYALVAVPYSLVRLAGWGPFGAYTASVAVLATAGFWGMVGLLRRASVGPAVGGVFGFVFAFGAMPLFKLGHGQTYLVMLAPVLGLMLVAGWRRRGWAVAAGVLFGLLTLTAAQTAWFLGLEAGLLLVVAALFSGRAGVGAAWRERVALVRTGAAWFAGLVVGLVPFALVYRGSFGLRRGWEEVRFYQPRFSDLLNVQPGEALWFDLLHRMGIADGPGRPAAEVMLGFTPGLVAFGAAGLVLFGRVRGRDGWDVAAWAGIAVAFLGWVLTVRWGRVDPWHWIYAVVPGAASVRTPFRIQLASSFFLCFGLGVFSSRVVWASAGRAWVPALVGAGLAVVALEQVGPPPPGRATAPMAQWLVASRKPDFACTAFYVLPTLRVAEPWFEVQSDAILLAVWLGLPTINGNSSWYPEGWDLLFTDRADYAARALAWIDRNGLRELVCGVDPRAGVWVEGVGPLTVGPLTGGPLTGGPEAAIPAR